ncbi:fluoroquinolone transport system ATP-binding protein [Natranaerovirga hydrolytica]|uniref:Fluoroquinolone transport system ATP-binding protein n=1 Tax=Natranaerovirga hydrolytica TaxID=680378 RepID=A0A4R1MZW0_9FIRM|nr:ABC transporter ATP-binding protein [Natranaerovirga hydrolytica]TCK98160.1 fluoroquinolone transport system ATP-binding protein [Natranaerovirga hydrolytica]
MFQVKDLQFRYPHNEEDTIRNISFEFEKGEIFGFLGPSGMGKSTTQKLMTKILTGYRGEINYMGKDLKSYDKSIFNDIGVGFEMPVLFTKLTALENLKFYRDLYPKGADIQPLLERLGLWKDRDKKVASFSKGMKSRLNFARALINDPKMLFLDEPTSGLDPVNARIVKDMISEFKANGGTVFLTTHLMHDVEELCDRVAFITNGAIKEISSPKDLKLRYGKREVVIEYNDVGNLVKETFDLNTISSNEKVFRILKNNEIITIHSGETTLDDIFIKVTGVVPSE